MGRWFRTFSLVAALVLLLTWSGQSQTGGSLDEIKKRGYLLWGSDAEGGAPYVFPDPNEPSRLIGFEVDLAGAIARELGVEARQAQNRQGVAQDMDVEFQTYTGRPMTLGSFKQREPAKR